MRADGIDGKTVVQAALGNAQAAETFGAWLIGYMTALASGYASGQERDDLVGEMVFKCWRYCRRYNIKACAPSTYFWRIGHSAMLDQFRFCERQRDLIERALDNHERFFASCFEHPELRLLVSDLMALALRRFGDNSKEQRVFQMLLDGWDGPTIAQALGLSKSLFCYYRKRVRRFVRKALNAEGAFVFASK